MNWLMLVAFRDKIKQKSSVNSNLQKRHKHFLEMISLNTIRSIISFQGNNTIFLC